MNKIFNFSAGPSMLPEQVLQKINKELYDWNGLGISVMEVSHRSEAFVQLTQNLVQKMREVLAIPFNYAVLFCHGGARAQFAAVPMNLLRRSSEIVDYINTGYWSYSAAMEAQKYCIPRIIDVFHKNEKNSLRSIQSMNQWNVSESSAYIHYCPNETIDGITINEIPDFCDKTVVADCSSMLLSKPFDISKFGIVYAAAQKNIGVSGLTVLIIRKDLIGIFDKEIPSILDYQILHENDSMVNTPVTVSWYIASLVLTWIKEQGGLEEIGKRNKKKATLLYKTIDSSDFYYNNIAPVNRSYMNIPFFLKNGVLNRLFLEESVSFGLYGLQGHRAVGGMRASLYNAMTLAGVERLIEFMEFFAEKYR